MQMPDRKRLEATVAPILEATNIPGAAVAIVCEGQILAEGFGRRNEAGLPVTGDTLYPIASTTKAMTATLIGMLVDQGLIQWDAPVQRYLKDFKLADPIRSPLVTIRDLLTMRTGLPRHDWLWLGHPVTRESLIERLPHLELSAGFRERFQYNNLAYVLAGHIAETVAGKSWESLIKENLLEPLGMTRTIFGPPGEGNVTQSWGEGDDGNLVVTGHIPAECSGPAGGSLYSSVAEMARWAAFNLDGGVTPDGRRLIDPRTLAEIRRAQMVMGDWLGTEWLGHSPWATYGMGWMVDPYNGATRLFHGGDLHQINGDISIFPDKRLGIVSFTNFGAVAAAALINEHIFDAMMGTTPVVSVEEKVAAYTRRTKERRQINAAPDRAEGTTASHRLEDYAARYRHPAYGEIVIELRAGTLRALRGAFDLPLEHWHYDSWVVSDASQFWPHSQHPFERSNKWRFETNDAGEVASLTVLLEPNAAPIRFARQMN
jgi:CubicO group peptidase (beta-lactamase class C family)